MEYGGVTVEWPDDGDDGILLLNYVMQQRMEYDHRGWSTKPRA